MIVQERNSLFVINYVCIVCPFVYSMPVPVYILLKSFTFCRNYIYASIICRSSAVRNCKLFFMKRKRNNWKWSFVVFSRWTDQLAQLLLHFKLKVFYIVFFFLSCTYTDIWSFVQLAYLLNHVCCDLKRFKPSFNACAFKYMWTLLITIYLL